MLIKMFKKILVIFILFFSVWLINVYWSNCDYEIWWKRNVINYLENCIDWTNLVQNAKVYDENWDVVDAKNLKVDDGFKKTIISWTKKIGWFLGIWAIFAIAFGSLKMTMSWWEEEAIKKGKDIVKWWVLGFLLVVSAGFIVAFVVNIIYWVLW